MKKKPEVSSRKFEFPVDEGGLQALINHKDIPVFPSQDGNGGSFGRFLDPGEYEGKGLPELNHDRQLIFESDFNFVVRVSCDSEGTTYLEIYPERHPTFSCFAFEGIEYRESLIATGALQERLSRFLILYGIYPLFEALYREKESDKKKRSDAYDKITEYVENYFKNIFIKEQPIETVEQGGLRITSYKQYEGRPLGINSPRKLSEREQKRKAERREKIVRAIREATSNENKSELARIIGITVPTLRAWLKGIGVSTDRDFYDLIRRVEND